MRSVIIDSMPAAAEKYRADWTIVVVDVIRFTTTVATALALGRAVYPARSTDEAFAVAGRLKDPLLAGELGGNVPYGFDMTNSPVQVMALRQVPCGRFTAADRPLVLVSSSGADLLMNSIGAKDVYLGCLRNLSALVRYVEPRHDRVAVLGAGTRGAFRREDQLCCSWIAERLVSAGFGCADENTQALVEKWHGASTEVIREGRSAEYLRRTGQVHDLEFILHYQEDLGVVPKLTPEGTLVDVARR
jgi:2-phosphosulfolactate phosphatase